MLRKSIRCTSQVWATLSSRGLLLRNLRRRHDSRNEPSRQYYFDSRLTKCFWANWVWIQQISTVRSGSGLDAHCRFLVTTVMLDLGFEASRHAHLDFLQWPMLSYFHQALSKVLLLWHYFLTSLSLSRNLHGVLPPKMLLHQHLDLDCLVYLLTKHHWWPCSCDIPH